MKPPIPYFGGKQRIAEQIVALFPAHTHYVEPYGGSLSVLLAKEPSKIETVNDLDAQLVTFWRVLRSRPEELITQCTFTPHARDELRLAQDDHEPDDDLEVARRVWVQLTQARTGTRRHTGWRFYIDATSKGTSAPQYLASYVRRMPQAAARLAQVSLESRPALEVIADYGKAPDSLLYVDPPYPGATRGGSNYLHEMTGDAEHRLLAEALAAAQAKVVLSGYASDLYRSLYADWNTAEIEASTQHANRAADHSRTEVCWLNFEQEHLFSEVPA